MVLHDDNSGPHWEQAQSLKVGRRVRYAYEPPTFFHLAKLDKSVRLFQPNLEKYCFPNIPHLRLLAVLELLSSSKPFDVERSPSCRTRYLHPAPQTPALSRGPFRGQSDETGSSLCMSWTPAGRVALVRNPDARRLDGTTRPKTEAMPKGVVNCNDYCALETLLKLGLEHGALRRCRASPCRRDPLESLGSLE